MTPTENGNAFNRLVEIMDTLREKCPWDKKQTVQTLRQLTIEETYELADAITENDWQSIREELGDLMLHLVFYAKIGAEQNQFTLEQVINGVCDKLIHRHPHIYPPADGPVHVNDEEDVKKNWEKLKLKEGKTSVLSGVPKSLPSMVKAMRLQEKAKQVGFEWDNKEQVWGKVEEEKKELFEAIETGDVGKIEDELGDVFFSLVNFARFLHVDAENALERTNKKFINRFTQMEEEALKNGKYLHDLSLEEMDAIWNRIKKKPTI
ncbi:MAG TPA: nucleoside triphosphate pyrophosphohydrolase [Ferruginibacter sp.]|jgi:XTP/dITP diphosphohydrolase|nr:nucleoside triphosphate pyrophosphohydrolase [Ferruginibacter sp.]